MADFNALEALINAYIKQNGVKAITGNILNGVLRGMVSALGKGWTIADGDATPTTDPGTMTGPVAYIAHTAGTYEHFGNLVVNDGEVVLLKYNEQTWTKEVIASLAATASIDGNVGTPAVDVTFQNGVLSFDFRNMKGATGDAAGFGTVNATVDANIGTPGVSVQTSGPDTAKNMTFAFTNLKGETGVTSVVVTVDNTVGTPSCAVSLVGQELHLDFHGLKGAQGDTGVSADYPITIVNNLTTNDPASALSAAMGVQLEGEISQLEHKVDEKLPIENNSSELHIIDKNGYIIAKIDADGIHAPNIESMVQDINGKLPIENNSDELIIKDSNDYIICKIDADGIHSAQSKDSVCCMVMSENFYPTATPTRDADGNVTYCDVTFATGVTGNLTITRTDGFATQVLVVYGRYNYTISITRDAEGNVESVSIV